MPRRNKRKRDRLSELPDDILAQILSNLPTIDSIRTCILSKRWERLWTHVTALHFDSKDYDDRMYDDPWGFGWDGFRDFVPMVLFRLASPTIESFSLSAPYGCVIDTSFFQILDLALANRRVKNLAISCEAMYIDDTDDIISLCHIFNIFNCHSLVHLRLDTQCFVRVPNFVLLPNLHTLELYRAHFTSDNDSDKENIILSFPVLKKLISYRTCWRNVQSVAFEVPFLEIVEIKETEYISDNCVVNYNIITEPSLNVNASVSFKIPYYCVSKDNRRQWGLRTCILLKQLNINKVKHLELLSTKVLSFAKESFVNLPTFYMLRHLKLDRISGEMLIEVLLKSPYLTSLIIQMMESSTYLLHMGLKVSKPDHAGKLLEYGTVPDCIRNTLKEFKIEDFGGCEDQLSLVKYMIKNAEHLELISLLPSELLRSSTNEMEKVKKELFSYKIKGFKFDYIGNKLIWDFEIV